MLDSLLGRAKLKEQIEELESQLAACEEELESVSSQYEATDRRRKKAIREAQEAQEERNRLEDRIEQLTDELDRVRGSADVTGRGRDRCGRSQMASMLDLLTSIETDEEDAYTAMLTDGDSTAVREHFGDRRVLLTQSAPCLCLFDDHGLIELAIEPPIPPEPFERWGDGFHLERSWFLPEGSMTFAVLRSDMFALGQYDGSSLAYLDGFESEVMGRHSKGGFSQARFERRREEQIERHLDKAHDRLLEVPDMRKLYLAGSQEAIDRIGITPDGKKPVDASGPPRQALYEGFDEFWRSSVHRL